MKENSVDRVAVGPVPLESNAKCATPSVGRTSGRRKCEVSNFFGSLLGLEDQQIM